MADTISPALTYELLDQVAVLRFDDGKANVLSHATIDAFNVALDRAEAEAGAVAVIGRPGRFCAGFDLSVMTAGIEGVRGLVTAGAEIILRTYVLPLPVTMACTGHALAAGAIWLLAGDIRIGEPGEFKIGMNEVAIGMPVPQFAVELGRDRLSRRHFGPAVQQARIYDPVGAVDAGYLDEVVAAGTAADAAVAAAATAAATLRRGAFRQTRHTMRATIAADIRAGLAADMARFDVES